MVNLLLEQEGINDTLKDNQGKTCLEVAKGKDTIRAIQGTFPRGHIFPDTGLAVNFQTRAHS